jgi:uncharacterized surface protein with fasciclin (FAS1) repeats
LSLTKSRIDCNFAGKGPTPFFAPTMQLTAFLATTPYATINEVPKEALTQILLNHVITTKLMAADLTTGYIKP